jgi:type I restriction enzyme, S subunit
MKAGWNKVSLGEICSFKYGQMPKKDDLVDTGYPVFSGYGVVSASTRFHYEEPQIIVVARGVGGTGDVKMSPPFCFLTNLSIAIIPHDKRLNKPFGPTGSDQTDMGKIPRESGRVTP